MSVEDRDSQETVPDFGPPSLDPQPGGFAPGSVIGDVWEVEQTLGKGGMGSVYRCHNRHASRILAAIKLLDPAFQYHPEAKARFLREAEILYTVDHPNVVKVSNVHLDARPPYLEMEFVDGMALEDELARSGALPPETAVDRATQLASALRYLHRKGIYHRDVKPQNILIRKDGTLKLVDFGLAVEKGGDRITTQDSSGFGTVSYCPPEWGRPGELDPAVWDLYALGVVLYEMLTGTVAFPVQVHEDPRRQMIQVMSDKQRIEALDPGPRFHPALREIVRRLTHKEPGRRIPSAKALFEGLEVLDPAWVPEPEAPPAPASGTTDTRSMLGMVGFFGGVIALGLGIGVVVAGIVLFVIGIAPSTRDADVLVTGVPADLTVQVRVADQPASEVDGARHHFLRLPVGEVMAEWVVGERCSLPCDEGCPVWCVNGETPIQIDHGEGVQVLGLDVKPPPLRTLRVRSRGIGRGFVRVDDREVAFIDDIATVDGVRPGPHALFAAAGECPSGCEGSACGSRCVVTTEAIVVPAEGRLPVVDLSLRAPEPEPVAPGTPRPAVPRIRPQITRQEYSDWLSSHPEWHVDSARSAGRADDTYLAGWQGTRAPGPVSGAVTNIPWPAAAAFCATRGGLAPLEADPATWEQGAPVEWRRGKRGARAWRRLDGATSMVVGATQANSSTGFRCAL